MKLMVIDVLDHFTTDLITETRVVARFIGEYIEEGEEYITLRHLQGNVLDDKCSDEYHKIVKSAILKQKSVEIEIMSKNIG
ncbi:hypothetical protein LCGC14_1527050 [marine sediment metagenome]|uniref:Uncharacterized protein n=1 Tax=marine sediment metagenome TaxID=412755 RepID=A0A0F9JHW7_9ZZZZ